MTPPQPSNNEHVAKKPRLLNAADGFSKPASSKGKSKAPLTTPKVQNFASAFEKLDSNNSTSKPVSKSSEPKPMNANLNAPSWPTSNPFLKQNASHNEPKAGPSRPAKRSFATTPLREPIIARQSAVDPMRFKPPPSISDKPNPSKANKARSELSVVKPPLPVLKVNAAPLTDDTKMRKVTLPPSITSSASTSKKPVSLKSMAPPPLPPPKSPPKSSSKSLRTISTTRMALATDPTSADGAVELLSLFLQDRKEHAADNSAQSSADVEAQRGVDLSPEKKGKGGPKFTRGGLAEQASRLYLAAHTSISLWQRELEHHFRISPNNLSPDLRLRITRIIHLPKPNPKSYCGLAECSVPDVDQGMMTQTDGSVNMPFFFNHAAQPRLVLFSFVPPPLSYSADFGIRTATRFNVGAEVLLWKPWQELNVVFSETSGEISRAKPVIFCSRFMISKG